MSRSGTLERMISPRGTLDALIPVAIPPFPVGCDPGPPPPR